LKHPDYPSQYLLHLSYVCVRLGGGHGATVGVRDACLALTLFDIGAAVVANL